MVGKGKLQRCETKEMITSGKWQRFRKIEKSTEGKK